MADVRAPGTVTDGLASMPKASKLLDANQAQRSESILPVGDLATAAGDMSEPQLGRSMRQLQGALKQGTTEPAVVGKRVRFAEAVAICGSRREPVSEEDPMLGSPTRFRRLESSSVDVLETAQKAHQGGLIANARGETEAKNQGSAHCASAHHVVRCFASLFEVLCVLV
jgi:hypothetical protein